jgi:hypothetical protein
MKIIFSILMLVTMASCYTQQKAAEQMDKAHSRHEIVAAGKCANWYPVRIDTTQGPTQYLPGIPYQVPGPTVYGNCDSIMKAIAAMKAAGIKDIPDGTRVPVNCPPSTVRVDTVKQNVYIVQENTAALREANLKQQASEKASQNKNGIIGALAVLFALAVIGNIIQFKSKQKS